jgi:hypothetical protein
MAQITRYEKGMAGVVTPPCEHYQEHVWCDCRETHGGRFIGVKNIGEVFLPHSCDEWIIGDKEALQDLIDDLQALQVSGLVKDRPVEPIAEDPESDGESEGSTLSVAELSAIVREVVRDARLTEMETPFFKGTQKK